MLASSGRGNAFRGGCACSILLFGSHLTFPEFPAIDILFRIYRSLVIGIFGAFLVDKSRNHNVKDLNYKTYKTIFSETILCKDDGKSCCRPNILRRHDGPAATLEACHPDLPQLQLHGHGHGEDGTGQPHLSYHQELLQRPSWT